MGVQLIPNQKTPKAKQQGLSELMTKEITLFGSSFGVKKKALWYDELGVLLTSGINLKQALELLAETQKKEVDQKMLSNMVDSLVSGTPFSEVIHEHKAFSDYDYYALKIGEQTGALAHIVTELGQFHKRKNDQRSEIISALTYPMIVLITAVVVVLFMLHYVVPMFVDIFKQNNVELPAITRAIVNFSSFLGTHGLVLMGVVVMMSIALFFASKKLWYRKFIGTLQTKLPILGAYVQKIYMAQFTQAIALLTASKVPLVDSIALVQRMISFYPLQKSLGIVREDVISGDKLSTACSRHPIFDKKMIALVRVSEETNQTEYVFQKLSHQYNHQVKQQSQLIANVLNPILTILVGILVGVILIAMYLPMFKLSTVIG